MSSQAPPLHIKGSAGKLWVHGIPSPCDESGLLGGAIYIGKRRSRRLPTSTTATSTRTRTGSSSSSRGVAASISSEAQTLQTSLSVCFDPCSARLAAVDSRGDIYTLNLKQNTFALVNRCGVAPAPSGGAIAFSYYDSRLLFVGCKDGLIRCFDTKQRRGGPSSVPSSGSTLARPPMNSKKGDVETSTLISHLRALPSSAATAGEYIHEIATDPDSSRLLSASRSTANLWDTSPASGCRKDRDLALNDHQRLRSAMFMGRKSRMLITCLEDRICIWHSRTWDMLAECLVPVSSADSANAPEKEKPFLGTTFSTDHRLICAVRESALYVWEMGKKTDDARARVLDRVSFLHVVALPFHELGPPSQICFVPGTKVVALLMEKKGVLIFVDVLGARVVHTVSVTNAKHQLFTSSSPMKKIARFCISSNGRYLACVTASESRVGGAESELYLYDLALARDFRERVDALPIPNEGWDEKTKAAYRDAAMSAAKSAVIPKMRRHRLGQCSDPDRAGSVAQVARQHPAISKRKLRLLLQKGGSFPSHYRALAWRILLHLPENRDAYAALAKRGPHPRIARQCDDVYGEIGLLHGDVRIKRQLVRVLSCLAYWSPVFSTNIAYMPGLVYPFVVLFGTNPLLCFEVVQAFLQHWCTQWFEFFPNPPVASLAQMETLLKREDKELFVHLRSICKVDISDWMWHLWTSLFSEVLSRGEWLQFMDHVVSQHPSFFSYSCLTYMIQGRAVLLDARSARDVDRFFRHQNAIDLVDWLDATYILAERVPSELRPNVHHVHSSGEKNQVGASKLYPAFCGPCPTAVVDFQIKEYNRIAREEGALRLSSINVRELEEKQRRLEERHALWARQQEMLQNKSREAQFSQRLAQVAEERKRAARHTQHMRQRLKQIEAMDQAAQAFVVQRESQQEETHKAQSFSRRMQAQKGENEAKRKERELQLLLLERKMQGILMSLTNQNILR